MNSIKKYIKGLLLISLIVCISIFLSSYLYIGSISIAIISGIIINYFFNLDKSFNDGINFSEKKLLSVAIVFMGASLNLSILSAIGTKVIFIIILIIIVAIFSSLIIGKIFNLSGSLSLLIGIGNGICGSSAIAGASSIIKSKKDDVALSISVINLLGTLGIFLLPLSINTFFSGDFNNIGIIIGSTIQAVGQVTAAGFTMGNDVGELAVIIKMIRILMLGPILILLTFFYSLSDSKSSKTKSFVIPPFIIGFTLFVIAANFNFIPIFLLPILKILSKYALLFAMAGIGLNISLKSMIYTGPKVFLVALLSFSLQIAFSMYLLS